MWRFAFLGPLLAAVCGCSHAAGSDPKPQEAAAIWKEKFLDEVKYHYETQQSKNAEIAAYKVELANCEMMIRVLRVEKAELQEKVANLEKRLTEKKD